MECGTAASGRLTGRGDRAGFRAAATIISTIAAARRRRRRRQLRGPELRGRAGRHRPGAAQRRADGRRGPAHGHHAARRRRPAAPRPAPTPPPSRRRRPSPRRRPRRRRRRPPRRRRARRHARAGGRPNVHTPLDLGVDIASVYDPYNAAIDQTDPADSYDQNPKTVFTFTTAAKPGGRQPGPDGRRPRLRPRDPAGGREGLLPHDHARLHGRGLRSKKNLPPDILDNRWHLLETRKNAGTEKGSDGLIKVTFDPAKYRHVLLWFTTPPPSDDPAANPTVGISETRILD